LIRYVELEKTRTHHEVAFSLEKGQTFKIHNRDLKKLHETGAAHAYLRSDDGQEVLVIPSDHENAPIKAYLLVVPQSTQTTISDTSLLKVFANQAQLLHHTLEEQLKANQAPMDLLDAAKNQAVGEVE
jgi:uncharacterized protein YcbX